MNVCLLIVEAFVPYYQSLVGMMKQLMTVTEDQDLILRCRATECMGLMALAVGPELFAPHLEECIKLGVEGCALDYVELREYTYGFFAHVAQATKADFVRFLPIIMPLLIASCDSTDGITGLVGDDGTALSF